MLLCSLLHLLCTGEEQINVGDETDKLSVILVKYPVIDLNAVVHRQRGT